MTNKVIKDAKQRMEGAVNSFVGNLTGLRTGRASASLLDTIEVDVYGSKMPLSQVGTVNVPEARLLSVQVWDKSNVNAVAKAISTSNLGLNASADGPLVRVPIPDLSEERRKEMVKIASNYAENARVAIRNVRRDAMDTLKKLEKDSQISEDEQHKAGEDVQKETDKFIKEIDTNLESKEKDIMEV